MHPIVREFYIKNKFNPRRYSIKKVLERLHISRTTLHYWVKDKVEPTDWMLDELRNWLREMDTKKKSKCFGRIYDKKVIRKQLKGQEPFSAGRKY